MEYGLVSKPDNRKAALKRVEISGELFGNALLVNSCQKYLNDAVPNGEFIYTFPLPERAAVYALTLKINETVIKGEIREKEAAFKLYDESLRQGDSAFLLEQIRDNVFQVSVGQLALGEEIEVEISYYEDLKTVDGEMRIRIPTVLAPRYISGTTSGKKTGPGRISPTDRVPDADLITPPIAQVDYKASIELKLNTLAPLKSIESPSHAIKIKQQAETSALVMLEVEDCLMDRDFILKLLLLGDAPNSLVWGENARGECFAGLSFSAELPPAPSGGTHEYIFLLDISGSMAGEKSVQAAQAIQICLRNLGSEDVFNLAAFESETYLFSPVSLPYDQQNLDRASAWVKKLPVMGGTEILPAVQFALAQSSDREKIVLIFTDGEVGNEKEIIDLVRRSRSNLRLYSIGIDTAVNSYLINEIAAVGNGYAEFVYPGEDLEEKILRHFSRIHASFLKDLQFEFSGKTAFEASRKLPDRIYDLEEYRLILKLDGRPRGCLTLSGQCGDESLSFEIADSREIKNGEIVEKLWARQKIAELNDYLAYGNPRRAEGIKADIVALSEKYQVISPLTSFVATYQRIDKLSGLPETRVIPVNAPHGWLMFSRQEPEPILSSVCFAAVDAGEATTGAVCPDFFSAPCIPFPVGPGRVFQETQELSLEGPDWVNAVSLNQLAAMQNSNGSFGNTSSGVSGIIQSTARAIVRLAGSSIISIYRTQIQKAVDYLVSMEAVIADDKALIDSVYEALEKARDRKIIRSYNRRQLELAAKLKDIIEHRT